MYQASSVVSEEPKLCPTEFSGLFLTAACVCVCVLYMCTCMQHAVSDMHRRDTSATVAAELPAAHLAFD